MQHFDPTCKLPRSAETRSLSPVTTGDIVAPTKDYSVAQQGKREYVLVGISVVSSLPACTYI